MPDTEELEQRIARLEAQTRSAVDAAVYAFISLRNVSREAKSDNQTFNEAVERMGELLSNLLEKRKSEES